MKGVRKPAIMFAVASAVYWQSVAWFVGLINPIAGADVAPYWMVALANFGSVALYAVVTLIFCHWLARRAAERV